MIRFDNSYARMPQGFFARVDPTPVTAPSLLALNGPLADRLGLDRDALTVEMLSGNAVPQGAAPLAQPMPGTSSAASCRSWATGAPSFWERSWPPTGRVLTSS